jgi:hypothetical protein
MALRRDLARKPRVGTYSDPVIVDWAPLLDNQSF